ncbi:aminotransferase, AHBA_syn family [Geotalea daltonii FRC-32]|uniref:Aminotransferase, AHBA_syn family n=1 Tax=Geotalea daltonii (strain DSM 22248 / JCM 15807 / FRC-32) TaxID=316067 RepID=B9M2X1_GEODF|nr:DegT/DnrJ/EryC1/StrS family aminotransferase [Geotalea daltonii]ACM21317.1 aminotransferase, AHBA_syn family [Geotalea daltonii FRC-32]
MRIGRSIPPAAAPISLVDILNGIRGLFNGQREIERFRDELKQYFGVKHCFLVSSGKAALTVILQALKELSPGREEVVIPAYTCYSVPAAVIRAGLKIRLCDMDSRTLGFDRKMLSSLLKGEGRILCVIPTHLFGIPCEIGRIRQMAEAGTILVEDAAQAMGGEYGGQKLGCLGDVGFFSLGRGKALSTVEGGIIVTNRDDIAKHLQTRLQMLPHCTFIENLVLVIQGLILWLFMRPSLFWLPKSIPFLGLGKTLYPSTFTLKYMSSFQAGLARRWLGKINEFKRARKEIVMCWQDFAGKTRAGRIFHNPGNVPDLIRFPIGIADSRLRTEILDDAERSGLGIMPGYPGPVNHIEQTRKLFLNQEYPVAEKMARELITFPVHPLVTVKDVRRVTKFLKKW